MALLSALVSPSPSPSMPTASAALASLQKVPISTSSLAISKPLSASLSPLSPLILLTKKVTLTATNTSGASLNAGSLIVSFFIATNQDLLAEGNEQFSVYLSSTESNSKLLIADTAKSVVTNINDDDVIPHIQLISQNTVAEGSVASYAVQLDGTALGAGQSFSFSLDSEGTGLPGFAKEGDDFAALISSNIQAAYGITLSAITTDPNSNKATLTATNTSGSALNAGSQIVSFSVATTQDFLVEGNEKFSISLAATSGVTITNADADKKFTASTSISDDDGTPKISLIGQDGQNAGIGGSVAEGSPASYAVVLDGTGLKAGQSFSFSLDTLGLSATEGTDFNALATSNIQAAFGITLSAISTDPVSKKVTVTATNTSGISLKDGSQIVTFNVATIQDLIVENGGESFKVTLADGMGVDLGTTSIATLITDDDGTPQISLIGPENNSVAEGSAASYAVALSNNTALAAGQSFSFSLDTASGSATEGTDYTALLASTIQAAYGITLSAISTDPATKKVTVTATNTSGAALNTGSQIVTFSVATTQDLTVEPGGETFNVTLADASGATLGNTIINTLISDDDGTAKILLIGEPLVAEGSAAAYAVALNGTAFAAGQSMVLTLDSVSGSAKEGFDFAALVPAALNPGNGIALSDFSTDPLSKAVSLTLTNSSSKALASNAQLLSFVIATIQDTAIENDETFAVTLASSDATVGNGFAFTTITDDDVKPTIRLSGETKVTEGTGANYAVVLEAGALSSGQSVTLILDTETGSALEGKDFSALAAANLQAALGVSLGAISTDPASKAVKVTVTNSSAQTLAAGSQLLTITIATTQDTLNEGNETFAVTIAAASDATVANAAPLVTTITDDDQPVIRLSGSSNVEEPGTASYSVRLSPADMLAVSQALTFVLDTASGTATEGLDFFPLLASAIKASSGLSLTSTITDPTTKAVTVTVTNSSGAALPGGTELVSFTVMSRGDTLPEADETFVVSLTSATAPSADATVSTTIQDGDAVVIKLAGSGGVSEGSSASYGVYLDGTGLGNGRKVSLSIDVTGITATEGTDFVKRLLGAQLAAASGLTLTSSDSTSTPLSVTMTNTSGADLPAGSPLLSFSLPTIVDLNTEGLETFVVNITSTTAKISGASVTTAISDFDTTPPYPGFTFNSQGTSPSSGRTKPRSTLGSDFGVVEFETENDTGSKASQSSLGQVNASVPLRQDAIALLNRYQVWGISGSRLASDPGTTLLELNLNLGQRGYSSLADVTLSTEVKATASLHLNTITGEMEDNTYDPSSGLGVELLDTNSNGLVDTLRVHLRDGAFGDDDGSANGRIQTSLLLAEAPRRTVYRFYNQRSGVHFYTSDTTERDNIIRDSYTAGTSFQNLSANPSSQTLTTSGMGYKYEGTAYQALETQGTALYRFYNASKGYHFLSTSAEEANNVIRNSLGAGYDISNAANKDPITGGWGYKYEGTSYKVSTIAQHGMDHAVYRFFNVEKGVHFYTISTEERDNVIRNSVGAAYVGQLDQARNAALIQGGWGYRFEGTAWYV